MNVYMRMYIYMNACTHVNVFFSYAYVCVWMCVWMCVCVYKYKVLIFTVTDNLEKKMTHLWKL